MRKLLDIKILEDGSVLILSDYRPLKGMNLYQQVFVALLFETDKATLRKWMDAIRMLGLADVCSCKYPQLTMKMFERSLGEVSEACGGFRQYLGGNLNFNAVAL